jgi:hypothetical protein
MSAKIQSCLKHYLIVVESARILLIKHGECLQNGRDVVSSVDGWVMMQFIRCIH